MKYKIEIWKYCWITDTFESDNIDDVLKWYKENWEEQFKNGVCSFDLYDNGMELSREEYIKLGF